MDRFILRSELRDPNEFDDLGRAVREWEPLLDVVIPPPDARLFEPDGTLYGVSLSDEMTVSFNRHDRRLARGDLIVVPRGLALDVEPGVDLFAVRYDGPPPDHFRERFIQVWGCEHLPAPDTTEPAHAETFVADTIPGSDLRHRIAYAVLDVGYAGVDAWETGLDLVLLVGVDGNVMIHASTGDGESAGFDVPPGVVLTLVPGTRYALSGQGRLGRLTLSTETIHRGRREEARDSGGLPGPEYVSSPVEPRRPCSADSPAREKSCVAPPAA